MSQHPSDFALACASHAPAILSANLALSPEVASGQLALHVERDAPSAAIAYNRAIEATTAPILILAHHDVYLPKGWTTLLAARIAELPEDWALFGSFGIGLDGAHIGPVWSSSLGMIVGRVPLTPQPVQSYDEMLIVLRRSTGLRFDEKLPGWHMYGSDIAQTARAKGFGAYAGALPAIHNDQSHTALGQDFTDAYRFMQRKWAATLPIRTPITKISRSGLHLLRDRWHNRRAAPVLESMSVGNQHPVNLLADRCGWTDLTP